MAEEKQEEKLFHSADKKRKRVLFACIWEGESLNYFIVVKHLGSHFLQESCWMNNLEFSYSQIGKLHFCSTLMKK